MEEQTTTALIERLIESMNPTLGKCLEDIIKYHIKLVTEITYCKQRKVKNADILRKAQENMNE